MRIKKDPTTKNEYIKADGIWIRNFTKPTSVAIDANNLFQASDYRQVIINETGNRNLNRSSISDESLYFPKVLIVSDGYDFENKHLVLANLPKDVAIFAVNGALAKWQLASDSKKRRAINLYVVNNPYRECLNYLPNKTKYYPTCIASNRTYVEFVSQYPGNLFLYEPSPSKQFGMEKKDVWHVDDYRNPICAAINLAFHFRVQKLGLFCCDESFSDERPSSVKLANGLWHYPQHQLSHQVIDTNLYWLTHQQKQEVQAVNHSFGPEYKNAAYIKDEEALLHFFNEPL